MVDADIQAIGLKPIGEGNRILAENLVMTGGLNELLAE